MQTETDKLNNNTIKGRTKSPSSSLTATKPHSSIKTTSLSKSSSVGEIRAKAKAANSHPRSSSASSNASTDVFNNNHHHSNRMRSPSTGTVSKGSVPVTGNVKILANGGNKANQNAVQVKEDAKTKADNKKNELAEKKKKEKARLKAEKEAKKVRVVYNVHNSGKPNKLRLLQEEKRIAVEEEKLAKMLAKEEKKRLKREAKELLLVSCAARK